MSLDQFAGQSAENILFGSSRLQHRLQHRLRLAAPRRLAAALAPAAPSEDVLSLLPHSSLTTFRIINALRDAAEAVVAGR
jgi:hypothetical protein